MEKVSLLKYKADIRTLSFVFISFAINISGLVIYKFTSWYVLIPMIIAACLMNFFVAVTVHNTIHVPIFNKKSWNNAYQYILSIVYGYSVSAYIPGHNLSHHKHLQTAKDTMRTTRAKFQWNLLNQALFFFVIIIDVIKLESNFVKKMKVSKPRWYKQYLTELTLVNIFKFAALLYDWQAGLLFIWLPNLYAVWGILGTNVWQHDGCDETHPYNHSRTFTNKVLNFFIFNNGYHGVHHDRPGLHWSLLPAYHREHVAPYLHPNLNRNSLLLYCFEAYIWPGKRVDYLGNKLEVIDNIISEDWIADLNFSANKLEFGAETVEE
jgi:beta-carotene hydroxylase